MLEKVSRKRVLSKLLARERYVRAEREVKRPAGRVAREQFLIVRFARTDNPENVLGESKPRLIFVIERAVRLLVGQEVLVLMKERRLDELTLAF